MCYFYLLWQHEVQKSEALLIYPCEKINRRTVMFSVLVQQGAMWKCSLCCSALTQNMPKIVRTNEGHHCDPPETTPGVRQGWVLSNYY